jgi:hypothetical protein
MEKKEKKWFVVMTETKDGTDRDCIYVYINQWDLRDKVAEFIEDCVFLFGAECYVYRVELKFFWDKQDRQTTISKLIECKRQQKVWIENIIKSAWSSRHKSDAQKKRYALKKQQENKKQ